MCTIYNNIRLANPYFPEQDEINVEALVDTGATHLCIPEHIALQLRLTALKEREVVTANGSHRLVKYAGPVRVSMLGRESWPLGRHFGGGLQCHSHATQSNWQVHSKLLTRGLGPTHGWSGLKDNLDRIQESHASLGWMLGFCQF